MRLTIPLRLPLSFYALPPTRRDDRLSAEQYHGFVFRSAVDI
ncbi:MAG: hypothetical protein AAFN81_16425 [Bacteroidota bacterium]